MTDEIQILGAGDEAVLANVSPGVFDFDVDARRAMEFLSDPRHHIAVAIDSGKVVGFVSAIHYIHPDKAPELWICEVGVAPTHQRRRLAKRLLQAIFEIGRTVGCREAWVLTDRSNFAAKKLYSSAGGSEAAEEQIMFTFKI